MEAFVTHPSGGCGCTPSRAAAAPDDLVRLEKLAYDANDNVREAALEPLRRLKKADAEPAIVAALDRTDVQLLRTAATAAQGVAARTDARASRSSPRCMRLTKEGRRRRATPASPLLDAIAVHADAGRRAGAAAAAEGFRSGGRRQGRASLITQLTGKPAAAEPAPVARGWPQAFSDLRQCVTVSLASGPIVPDGDGPGAAPDHGRSLPEARARSITTTTA